MNEKQNNIWGKWIYWFIFAVSVILVYKTLDNFNEIGNWISNLFGILMPFIVGIIIAYLFYIPSKNLEKLYKRSKKLKIISRYARFLSVITIYAIAITLFVMVMKYIIPTICTSIIDLVNNFQNYYNSTVDNINQLPDDSFWKSDAITNIVKEFQNIQLKDYINVDKVSEYAQGAITIVSGIFNFFVSIIVSIYLLLERNQIIEFAKKITKATFDNKNYKRISKYFGRTNEIFLKFIESQLLDGIVVGILTSIAMSIMGVKYAILLGVMIGLFNMIPYFGAIIAVIIAGIITLLTGGISQAILMIIVVTILQQIDANIINPKIVGESLKISPLLVIFAVTMGGAYFKVLGMFIAVPIVAVLKLLITDYIELKSKNKIKIEE